MSAAEIASFSTLERELLEHGYEPGVPDPECEQDRERAESARCSTCGAPLSFVPFTRWSPEERHTAYTVIAVRSEYAVYRAFAVCRKRDNGRELEQVPS